MPSPTNYDLAKVILDLLTIAKVATQGSLVPTIPSVRSMEAQAADQFQASGLTNVPCPVLATTL